MALKDIFSKKKVTQKSGTIRVFILKSLDLDPELTFEIKKNSFIGHVSNASNCDFVLEHKSISDRHLEIVLEDEVVLVSDHDSKYGSYLNKKKLAPFTKIILKNGDLVKLGRVKFKFFEEYRPLEIKSESESSDGQSNSTSFENFIEDVGVRSSASSSEANSTDESENVSSPANIQSPEIVRKERIEDFDFGYDNKDKSSHAKALKLSKTDSVKNQKKLKKLAKKNGHIKSANALFRLLGLFFDLLIFFILMTFREVSEYLRPIGLDLHTLLSDSLLWVIKQSVFIEKKLALLTKTYPGPTQLIKTLYLDITEYLPYFFLFVAFQILGTLLFSKTLGQYLAGLNVYGPSLLKRPLGVLRVVINYLFLPLFFILELPTLFSKRSFKEVVTFTSLDYAGKFRPIFSLLIFTPFAIIFFLSYPLIKDLRLPRPIKVKASIESKEKGPKKSLEGSNLVRQKITGLGDLELTIGKGELGGEVFILPGAKIYQRKGRKFVKKTMRVLLRSKDDVALIELSKDKSLNLSQMFLPYFNLNPVGKFKYAQLYSELLQRKNQRESTEWSVPKAKKLAQEFHAIYEGAFSFTLENSFHFLMQHGPFFAGHMDVREKFLSLVDYPLESVAVRKSNDNYLTVLKLEKEKLTYVEFFSLNHHKPLMYKLTSDRDNIALILDRLSFNKRKTSSPHTALLLTDAFSKKNKTSLEGSDPFEKFQRSYQYFFNMGALFFADGDEKSLSILQKSLREMLKLLELNASTVKFPQRSVDKLAQNLNDLLRAIVEKDRAFFNLKTSV